MENVGVTHRTLQAQSSDNTVRAVHCALISATQTAP